MDKKRIIKIFVASIGFILMLIVGLFIVLGLIGLVELLIETEFPLFAKVWYFFLIGIGLLPFGILLIEYQI